MQAWLCGDSGSGSLAQCCIRPVWHLLWTLPHAILGLLWGYFHWQSHSQGESALRAGLLQEVHCVFDVVWCAVVLLTNLLTISQYALTHAMLCDVLAHAFAAVSSRHVTPIRKVMKDGRVYPFFRVAYWLSKGLARLLGTTSCLFVHFFCCYKMLTTFCHSTFNICFVY